MNSEQISGGLFGLPIRLNLVDQLLHRGHARVYGFAAFDLGNRVIRNAALLGQLGNLRP